VADRRQSRWRSRRTTPTRRTPKKPAPPQWAGPHMGRAENGAVSVATMTVVQPRARYLDRHCAKRTKQLACSPPMPIAGRTARDISGSRTLITRASQGVVQFRLHKVLDEPPHPIPNHRLKRVCSASIRMVSLSFELSRYTGQTTPRQEVPYHEPITPPAISTTFATGPLHGPELPLWDVLSYCALNRPFHSSSE
jgi:hypothetical protein